MTPAASSHPGLSRAEWRVLILLVASIFINYIDRGNLSVAAPPLKSDLGLTDYELGKLLSSFFWTYSGIQLIGAAGWLVDRFSVGWVLAIAYFLWSGATAASGAVTTFGALLALRLVLGVSESVAYPAYSKILAGGFPEYHRGLANALIDAGSKIGPALGTLMGGVLMARFGWRAFFVTLGLGSMLWLIPWLIWMPRDTAAQAAQARDCASAAEILTRGKAWGIFFGHFAGNYYWYFLLTWLPFYLVRERGFSMSRMGFLGGLTYLTISVATVAGGYFSDRWIRAGGTPTRVRKSFTTIGLAGATVILPVASVHSENLAIVLLLIASFFYGLFSSNHWAIAQTVSGPKAAGKWTGLQNGVANLAGVIAPWLTGAVAQWTGSFVPAFVVTACIALAGASMYVFVVGEVAPIAWKERS